MNKKLAHTILFIGNFLCLGVLWIGFHEFNHTLMDNNSQPDSIRFGNRDGFFIVAIGYPLIYFFVIIEHFRPALIKEYKQILNYSAIFMVIILLAAGFFGSSWITTNEYVKAYLVLKDGVEATPEEFIAWAKDNMAGYKRPRDVVFVDELPMTAVGKVLRRELKEAELAKK